MPNLMFTKGVSMHKNSPCMYGMGVLRTRNCTQYVLCNTGDAFEQKRTAKVSSRCMYIYILVMRIRNRHGRDA